MDPVRGWERCTKSGVHCCSAGTGWGLELNGLSWSRPMHSRACSCCTVKGQCFSAHQGNQIGCVASEAGRQAQVSQSRQVYLMRGHTARGKCEGRVQCPRNKRCAALFGGLLAALLYSAVHTPVHTPGIAPSSAVSASSQLCRAGSCREADLPLTCHPAGGAQHPCAGARLSALPLLACEWLHIWSHARPITHALTRRMAVGTCGTAEVACVLHAASSNLPGSCLGLHMSRLREASNDTASQSGAKLCCSGQSVWHFVRA